MSLKIVTTVAAVGFAGLLLAHADSVARGNARGIVSLPPAPPRGAAASTALQAWASRRDARLSTSRNIDNVRSLRNGPYGAGTRRPGYVGSWSGAWYVAPGFGTPGTDRGLPLPDGVWRQSPGFGDNGPRPIPIGAPF